MNQAFLVSFFGAIFLVLVVIPFGKRRPVDKPLLWGEALLASVYIFATMFVAFGMVPHQWLDHADKDLGWSRDKLLYGPGGILKPVSAGGWNPITLQYQAVRDIVVVVLHLIFFGLFIFVAIWWQKRGAVKPKELPTSTYGRPLVKKA
jgi:hypothetical protein